MLNRITSRGPKLKLRAAALVLAASLASLTSLASGQHQLVAQFDVDRCLECLCLASSRCSNAGATSCAGQPNGCGAYKLSFTYWADAGALTPASNKSRFDDEDDFLSSSSIALLASPRDFEKCALDAMCARRSVKNYFLKYANDCNADGKLDCLDMAAMHRAGSAACSAGWLQDTDFWHDFLASGCVAGQPQSIFAAPSDMFAEPRVPMRSASVSPVRRADRSLNLDGVILVASSSSSLTRARPPVARNATPPALDHTCLECICEAQSNCDLSGRNCNSGTVCGPFAITSGYWLDAGAPGSDWISCTRMRSCSEAAVRNYMAAFAADCDSDGRLTCADIAAVHHLGPSACHSASDPNVRALNPFFSRFDRCRARLRPSTVVSSPGPPRSLQPPLQPPPRPLDDASLVSAELPRPPPGPSFSSSFRPPSFEQPDPAAAIPQAPPRNMAAFRPPRPPPPPPTPAPPTRPVLDSELFADELPRPPTPSLDVPDQPTDETPRPPRAAHPLTAASGTGTGNASLSAECFECICEASTGCNPASRCQSSDVRRTRCGLFLVSYEQWLESGLSSQLVAAEDLLVDPAADERAFYACVTERQCAERVLAAVFARASSSPVALDCNRDGKIDCYDFAALHMASRAQCSAASFLESQYWTDFNTCFGF